MCWLGGKEVEVTRFALVCMTLSVLSVWLDCRRGGVIDYVYWDDLVNLIYLVDHVLDHCSGLDELRRLALPAGCPGCLVSPVGP